MLWNPQVLFDSKRYNNIKGKNTKIKTIEDMIHCSIRAVPIGEAMVAIVLADLELIQKK